MNPSLPPPQPVPGCEGHFRPAGTACTRPLPSQRPGRPSPQGRWLSLSPYIPVSTQQPEGRFKHKPEPALPAPTPRRPPFPGMQPRPRPQPRPGLLEPTAQPHLPAAPAGPSSFLSFPPRGLWVCSRAPWSCAMVARTPQLGMPPTLALPLPGMRTPAPLIAIPPETGLWSGSHRVGPAEAGLGWHRPHSIPVPGAEPGMEQGVASLPR